MRTIEPRIVSIVGDDHEAGSCNGSYCVLDSWHGRCYTGNHPSMFGWESCGLVQWSCWQKSCVEAWAQGHDGCHVAITHGLAS